MNPSSDAAVMTWGKLPNLSEPPLMVLLLGEKDIRHRIVASPSGTEYLLVAFFFYPTCSLVLFPLFKHLNSLCTLERYRAASG